MFCVRCGNAVNENEFFCNMCGTKINQSLESINKNYFDSERRLSIIEYSELINKLAFNLQEFEISNNEYIKNEKRYKDIEKSIVPNRRAKRILIPLGIAFVYYLLSGTFIFKYNLLHAIICIFTTFSVWLGTLLILIFVVKDPSKGTAKIINECKKKMEETQNRCAEIVKAIYPQLQHFVPKDYWYSSALFTMASYFRNGRAHSMKEAINLYEEEMHRLRMENMQEQVLRQNQKQTTYTAITAFNTLFR